MSVPRAILDGRLLPQMSFPERVWCLTVRVPRGKVTTYGWIARALGTRAWRGVGQALHRNPYAPRVPCHRVVRADGTPGGYARGAARKKSMLVAEGVPFLGGRVDLAACGVEFRGPRRRR